MGESRIDIPQTPQVTEKAEDEGGKGTQIISSIPQTPQVTEKTEDKGGKSTQNNSSMLKDVLRFLHVSRTGSSQPPEKANDQVGIQPQSNDLAAEKLMFPLGLSHLLPHGSENIESELLAPDSPCNFEVKNMKGDTPKIRKWYVGVERRLSESNRKLGRMMDRYSDEELGRMMARSGLLLLEFLRFLADLPRSSKEFFQPKERQLSVQEAVIKIDNQIPIFVLKKILEWERDADLDCILKQAWPKLSPIQYESPDSHVIAGVPLKDDSHLLEFVYENIISSSDFEHPLEFVYENIIGSPSHPSGTTLRHKRRVRHITLPRAEQLKGKGVKFARNEGLLKKIRFDRRNLTLYLPAIEMDGGTAAVLRNLVLFEASKQGKESQPLMSYVNLMDRLIDTAEDVQGLGDGGIIHANLGSNIEVAKVWNGMCKLIDKKIKYEPIDKAIYDVKNFYTNKYRTMCTEFYGTHFSKPWSAISFFAACILFALAGFQTYLAWEQVRLQRESMLKT
jgi:hypothetical protein